ncbi:hypothetical protein [Helicobacter sp. 23-1045]
MARFCVFILRFCESQNLPSLISSLREVALWATSWQSINQFYG